MEAPQEGETRVPDPLTQDVIAIIAREQRLPEDTISPESTFEQLRIDSLDGVNIVFALEEKYNLTIPDEIAREMRSVGQVIDALRQQLNQGLNTATSAAT